MAESVVQSSVLMLTLTLVLAFSPDSKAQARRGSGTSRVPDSTPMDAQHFSARDWSFMLHGFFNLVYQNESEPRGRKEWFTTNMVGLDAERTLWGGHLETRVMASLEPALGADGYPSLLQTGESADGRNPLFDRQHPHDLLMELSVRYARGPWFVYVAPAGDPALGPSAFMHRASSRTNPVAPLSHHWLDATHISYGVVSVGWAPSSSIQIEGSAFNGREPDQDRWGVESFRLDSYAARVTVNPSRNWSFQASVGRLHEPDRLHPGLDVVRATVSATYNRPFDRGNWQSTLAWGRNDTERLTEPPTSLPPGVHIHFTPGISPSQDALLAETGLRFFGRHAIFSRIEWAQKDELFIAADRRHDEIYSASKLSVGYGLDVLRMSGARFGVGAYVNLYWVDEQLTFVYGGDPKGAGVFVRLSLE